MMDTNQPRAADAWIKALEESRAELAAGRTVDGHAMRQRLCDTIRQMEAELEREQPGLPKP